MNNRSSLLIRIAVLVLVCLGGCGKPTRATTPSTPTAEAQQKATTAEPEQKAVPAKRSPAVQAAEKWGAGFQSGFVLDWKRAEGKLVDMRRCSGELGNLMKGMEFVPVTLSGSLQSLSGTGQCWRVAVPAQGKIYYEAEALVICLHKDDLRILAAYALPKAHNKAADGDPASP